MAPESFFHVAIKVENLDESIAFYRTYFDAEIFDRGEARPDDPLSVTYVATRVADKRVYLFEEAPYEAAGLVDSVRPGFLHFGFIVDDIEEMFASLVDDGVGVVMEPTTFGDLRIAFVTDPNDVRVELLEHLDR